MKKADLKRYANGIWIKTPIDPQFMSFKARVFGEGIDEGLNGERNDPRVRNYLAKDILIDPKHVDPETDIREGVQWLELRFHAREFAEEWDVLPIYTFLVSHLEGAGLTFPTAHDNFCDRQEYMVRTYRDQWVAQRFREYNLNKLQEGLKELDWPEAADFVKMVIAMEKFEWPTEEQYQEVFNE